MTLLCQHDRDLPMRIMPRPGHCPCTCGGLFCNVTLRSNLTSKFLWQQRGTHVWCRMSQKKPARGSHINLGNTITYTRSLGAWISRPKLTNVVQQFSYQSNATVARTQTMMPCHHSCYPQNERAQRSCVAAALVRALAKHIFPGCQPLHVCI
eukprot:366130-Chlamydomonas_euryale.AAC.64